MNIFSKYIRSIIYSLFALIGCIGILIIITGEPSQSVQLIKITQFTGLVSLVLLYITLLISPFYATFPQIPGRSTAIRARRALGVSAFFFALAHTLISFFGTLGGFSGIGFLQTNYLFSIVIGFVALLILTVLAVTSYDAAIIALGKNWRRLHRTLYAAALLILLHVYLLGSHFSDILSTSSTILLISLLFLLLLESVRINNIVSARYPSFPRRALVYATIAILFLFYLYTFYIAGPNSSLNIHAAHIREAETLQHNQTP